MKTTHFIALALSLSLSAGWQTVSAQTAAENPILYEVLERLEQLETELRQLRGDFEYLQYQLERRSPPTAQTPPADISSEFSLPLPQSAAPERPDSPVIQERNTTPLALVPATPGAEEADTRRLPASLAQQESYNLALQRLRQGQYPLAAQDFQRYIARYPNSGLIDKAYFWLGEAFYAQRDFDQAKQAFLTLGSEYPDSQKLPDALLKLGYIYDELGDIDRAKTVLQKLVEAFPGGYAANLASKHLKLLEQ